MARSYAMVPRVATLADRKNEVAPAIGAQGASLDGSRHARWGDQKQGEAAP